MDARESRRNEILTRPLLPLLIKTALPTIIGMLVSMIYNMTDLFFVGLLQNKSMTAAIGIVFGFAGFVQAVGFWFGYGSGNAMAKKIGEQDYEGAQILSCTGMVFALGGGMLAAVLAGCFVWPLAKAMGGSASPALLEYTRAYLQIIILSIPFSLYAITLYNQLRLCGSVKDAAAGLLAGMLCNMILDPVFMFGLKLGFRGAGYATLTGQGIGCLVLTVLSGRHGNISVSLNKIQFGREEVYHILAGGLPNFSRQAVTSVALILQNFVAAGYGENMIAALAVSSKAAALAYMVMVGWGQGFQPICAMNYGAKQYGRVRKAFWITVAAGTVFLLLSSVLLYIFALPCIQMLSKDESVAALGVGILRMQCLTMPLLAFFAVSSMLMQNMGNYLPSLWISISRQGMVYAALLGVLPGLLGQFGMVLIQPVSDVLSFLLAIFIMSRYGKVVYVKH